MGNLGHLIGNGIRYVSKDSYSNLEDYREWDNGLVYKKYRSAMRILASNYPMVRNFRLSISLLGLVYLYGIVGIFTFMWLAPGMSMFTHYILTLTLISLMAIFRQYLYNGWYHTLRARILAGEILGFENRDRLWDQSIPSGSSKIRYHMDREKRREFYLSLLQVRDRIRVSYLGSIMAKVMLMVMSAFVHPMLPGFWLSFFLSLHLVERYIDRHGFPNARRLMVLREYGESLTSVDNLDCGGDDDGFVSYLSFSRYLLSLKGYQYDGLKGWVYRGIYRWHFKPSRLRRLLDLNRVYRDLREGLIGRIDSYREDLELSLDSEGSDGEDIVRRLAVKDDENALPNVAKDPESMEILIVSLCNNGNLFNRAWLSLFKSSIGIKDEYLDIPMMDDNEVLIMTSFKEPGSLPVLDSVLPDWVMSWLLYLDTLIDTDVIRRQIEMRSYHSGLPDRGDGKVGTVRSILDFKNRNEVDRLVGLMSWDEWDRLAMEKVSRDSMHLDPHHLSRIYAKGRMLDRGLGRGSCNPDR